ncbi:hypothetical protein KSP40_PGU017081 [Platanthera guangdongensis]|uniref:beta-ketoacyl-[acyl-carrier-protein] synthase I n=1 Tax=Platanthera guangdongensis TaxID=2320717 RepID=A0ABR2MAE5_9ASPA
MRLRHLHASSWQRQGTIDKVRAGVLIGTGMGGLTVFSDGVQALIDRGYRKITPFFIPYAITNMGSALLAMDIGFMGANYSISTACATSNYCFYAAANHIRRGEVDLMIAGGTEAAIIPIGIGGFVASSKFAGLQFKQFLTAISLFKIIGWRFRVAGSLELHPGINAALVLESLEHAMNRDAPIIAEYLGGAVNCDAYHMTDPRADGLGVSTCIKKSLEDAGVSTEELEKQNGGMPPKKKDSIKGKGKEAASRIEKFTGEDALMRFQFLKTIPLIYEREFRIVKRWWSLNYVNQMQTLKCNTFCHPRIEAVLSWVFEFYANAKFVDGDKVLVRGKINFFVGAIRDYFDLENHDPDEFSSIQDRFTPEDMATLLCVAPGPDWWNPTGC